jgi:hypothetical protein
MRPVRTGTRSPRTNARHGAVLTGSLAMEMWNHWHENGLGSSVFALLHRNPLELAKKGVLIGVGLGSVETRRQRGRKWCAVDGGVGDEVLLLHRQEQDIRN